MFPVYLDYNATTPVDEEVIEEVSRSMKAHWGNPSSFHVLGQQAKDAIEQSRVAVARMLNANSEDIIFTSGGTEVRLLFKILPNKIKILKSTKKMLEF